MALEHRGLPLHKLDLLDQLLVKFIVAAAHDSCLVLLVKHGQLLLPVITDGGGGSAAALLLLNSISGTNQPKKGHAFIVFNFFKSPSNRGRSKSAFHKIKFPNIKLPMANSFRHAAQGHIRVAEQGALVPALTLDEDKLLDDGIHLRNDEESRIPRGTPPIPLLPRPPLTSPDLTGNLDPFGQE